MAEIQARLELKGWNATQLKLRVPAIISAYGDVMDRQLKEEIKAVQFSWPRVTYRTGKFRAAKSDRQRNKVLKAQGGRKGVAVGSPRDIVDSGTFLRSQQRFNDRPGEVRFTWDATSDDGFMYAGLILTGGSVGERSTPIPPRNWIKPALDKHPLNAFFVAEWRRLGQSRL